MTGAYDPEAVRRMRAESEAKAAGGLFADPPAKLGRTFSEYLDGRRLTSKMSQVLALMLDGEWHTTDELRAVGGSSGDRRARQLRDEEFGGFNVEAERVREGLWHYRLVNPDPASVSACLAKLEGVARGTRP